jgi:hypothetical protein
MAEPRSQSDNGSVHEDDQFPPWLDALWQRTLEAWDDDATHAALLEHALRTETLPEVAGRYRALVDDPEKGARAKAQIDAIVLAATSLLFSKKTPAPGKTPWPITLSAVGVCLLLFSWLAWELFPHR